MVEAALEADHLVAITVDGARRVELRPQAMVGGYAFEVGESERHRVEVFYVAGEPPRLEAQVDGAVVLSRQKAGPAPGGLLAAAAALLVGGAVALALGALLLAGVARAVALGAGGLGLALGALAILAWRRRRGRPPRRVEVPAQGEAIGRCSVHGDLARVLCGRCRRPLCPSCAAFERGRGLLCDHCAGMSGA